MSDTDKTRPLHVILAEHGFTSALTPDIDFTASNNNPWINWDKLEINHENRKMLIWRDNRAARTNLRNSTRAMMLLGNWDIQPEPPNHRHSAKWLSS